MTQEKEYTESYFEEHIKQVDDGSEFGKECLQESISLLEKGEYENALRLAKRALEQTSCGIDMKLYCNIHNVTGVIYGAMGNELMAVEHYLAGLAIAKKKFFYSEASKLYNNIGAEYQMLGDHANAVHYFRLAMKEMEKEDESDRDKYEYRSFITYMNMCEEYYAMASYEEAEEMLNRAGTFLAHESVKKNKFGYLLSQCRLLLRTGNEEQVRASYAMLLDMAFHMADRSSFWREMEGLCNLSFELGDFEAAKSVIDYMEQQAKLITDETLGLDARMKIYESLLTYYQATKNEELLRKTEKEYVSLCRRQRDAVNKSRAVALDYKIQLNEQYEENCAYKKQVYVDALTGVGNRNKLEKDYKKLAALCEKKNYRISVGIIDLDYFKEVNDTYGHLKGDEYLKIVSQLIKKVIAGYGDVYRYGGDEFVVLLIDADKQVTEELAEKIQCAIEQEQLENNASSKHILTVSQGYIMLDNMKPDIWHILSLADKELYVVKRDGRDGHRIRN